MTTSVLDWQRLFSSISFNDLNAHNASFIDFSSKNKSNTIDSYLLDCDPVEDSKNDEFSPKEVENIARIWRNKNLK